jgi:hypothetical protein
MKQRREYHPEAFREQVRYIMFSSTVPRYLGWGSGDRYRYCLHLYHTEYETEERITSFDSSIQRAVGSSDKKSEKRSHLLLNKRWHLFPFFV